MRGHRFQPPAGSTLLEKAPQLPTGALTDEFARELLELGQVVLDRQGLYLWFLGD
ncbi:MULTISPECIES: hypothetical protein [unclassified Streptomyces]|uniref:hypothetical protein n=1 Tax=unclassified Streptomyces TaxID=2593676 RepID=UPI0035D8D3C2